MKRYSSRDGGRVWYSDRAIEELIETALVQSGLMPTLAHPVTDLEKFLERHLDVKLEEWADLGPDVLGSTDFNCQPVRVSINRILTERVEAPGCPPGLKGRWRATLAHEASHVILHEPLFQRISADQGDLFPADPRSEAPRLQRCLLRDIEAPAASRQGSDWREVQANKGMAALLMPRSLFVEAAKHVLQSRGIGLSEVIAGSLEQRRLLEDLAGLFEVSKQACEIRLRTVGLVHDEHRPMLPFE